LHSRDHRRDFRRRHGAPGHRRSLGRYAPDHVGLDSDDPRRRHNGRDLLLGLPALALRLAGNRMGRTAMDHSQTPFATVEQALAEIRAGRMIVLVDDEDRENEGDLTMAAEKITPEAINFMAKH